MPPLVDDDERLLDELFPETAAQDPVEAGSDEAFLDDLFGPGGRTPLKPLTSEQRSQLEGARADRARIPLGARAGAAGKGFARGVGRGAVELGIESIDLLTRGGGIDPSGFPQTVGTLTADQIMAGEASLREGAESFLPAPGVTGEARFLERVGFAASQAAPFTAGQIARGRQLLRQGERLADIPRSRFLRRSTLAAGEQPGTTAAFDAAAVLSGEAVGEAARRGGAGPGMETGAVIGGSLVPGVAATGIAALWGTGGLVKRLVMVPAHRRNLRKLEQAIATSDEQALGEILNRRGASPFRPRRTIGDQASEQIRERMGGPEKVSLAREILDRVDELRARQNIDPSVELDPAAIMGLDPSVDAQMPGLTDLVWEVFVNNPRVAHDLELALKKSDRAVLQRFIELGAAGLGDVDATVAAAEDSVLRQMAEIEDQARQLVPDGDPEQISAVERQLIDETFQRESAANSGRWGKVGELAAGVKWDARPLKRARSDMLAPLNVQGGGTAKSDRDLLPHGLLNLIDGFGDVEPFEELRRFRQRVSAELRVARNKQRPELAARVPFLVRLLDAATESLDTILEPIPIEQRLRTGIRERDVTVADRPGVEKTPETVPREEYERRVEVQTAYLEALAGHAEFAQRWRQRITGELTRQESPIEHSATLSRYLHGGPTQIEDAAEFFRNFGRDPEIVKLGNDFLIAEAYQAAWNPRGRYHDPRRLQSWIQARSRILPRFPRVQEAVADIDRLLLEARKVGTPIPGGLVQPGELALRNYVKNPSTIWNHLRHGDTEAKLTGFLRRIEGDDAAMAGLRSSYMDDVMNRRAIDASQPGIVRSDARGLAALLQNPSERQIIKRLFGEEHLRNLEDVVQLQGIVDRSVSGGRSSPRNEESLGEAVKRFGKASGLITQIISGRQRAFRTTFAGQDLVRSLTDQQVNVILDEMPKNPVLLRLLLEPATKEHVARVRRWLNANIPGVVVRDVEREQEDDRRRRLGVPEATGPGPFVTR